MTNTTGTTHAPLTAPLAQPRRPRKASALLLGTALGAIVGMGYGRGAYAQANPLSGTNTSTISLTGPDEFVTEDGFSVDTSELADSIAIDVTTDGGTINTTLRDDYQSVIQGADQGLRIYKSDGTGDITVTSTGLISTSQDESTAVNIRQFLNDRDNFSEAPGGAVSITVDEIYSSGLSSSGIEVYNRSAEGVTVTANGDVLLGRVIEQYGSGSGIDVGNAYGGDILISAYGDIYAGNKGITAYQFSDGNVTINADGQVRAYAGSGVQVDLQGERGDINITVNDVDGQMATPDSGLQVSYYTHASIFATSASDGHINITSTGDVGVAGNPVLGIYAANTASGSGITINANNVEGGRGASQYDGSIAEYADAIRVLNAGGALSITATGDVDSSVRYGIYAYNKAESSFRTCDPTCRTVTEEGTATDLTITANNVTGGYYGITADNDGTGALSITSTGTVTGTAGGGIYANNSSNSTSDLTITANEVTGGEIGIFAVNYSSGDLTISVDRAVGQNAAGINAVQRGSGNLDVSARDVTGARTAIGAFNYGQGSIIIDATGFVEASQNAGIYAYNSGSSTGDVTITANDVNGAYSGISVNSFGNGAVNITANGVVTGRTGDGITAYNASSEDLTITIAAGGSVSTYGTWAIAANAPNGTVIVDNFGTVTGPVNLTSANTWNSNSGTLANTFTNSGTWDLANTTSDFNATGNSLVVNEGLIVAARNSAVNEISVIDNLDIFRNNVGGTIRLADGAAGDEFQIATTSSGTGNFIANGGTIELDVVLGGDGSAADKLVVSGDVILEGAPTALDIKSVGGGTGADTTNGIEVVSVTGTSDEGAFVLAGLVEVGAFAYDLAEGTCGGEANDNWYLCSGPRPEPPVEPEPEPPVEPTIGTTGAVFEAMPGIILATFARSDALQQRLGSRVTGVRGTISTRGAGRLPVDKAVGPWMRVWGDFADITPDTSTARSSWEVNSWGLEAGIGAKLGEHAGGDLVGGVNLRYGASSVNLRNPVGTGSFDSEGFGLGTSLTWFGNNGLYLDAVGSVDFVSIDATSQGGGELVNGYDDVVYSASAEIGKRIELQGGTALIPQAQLSWGKMRDGQFTDKLGNVISFADRETLTSRIGLTVEQDVTDTAFGSGKIYGFGNMLNDLSGSRTVTVAGTDVTQSGTGDWIELGGGFSLKPSEGTNLFGQVSYREAFDGVSGGAIAVSAGWKMQW